MKGNPVQRPPIGAQFLLDLHAVWILGAHGSQSDEVQHHEERQGKRNSHDM